MFEDVWKMLEGSNIARVMCFRNGAMRANYKDPALISKNRRALPIFRRIATLSKGSTLALLVLTCLVAIWFRDV